VFVIDERMHLSPRWMEARPSPAPRVSARRAYHRRSLPRARVDRSSAFFNFALPSESKLSPGVGLSIRWSLIRVQPGSHLRAAWGRLWQEYYEQNMDRFEEEDIFSFESPREPRGSRDGTCP